METMIARIIARLTTELTDTPAFDANLLELKVRGAAADVKRVRRYPKFYSDEMIDDDMLNFEYSIESIARYDYSQIGVEYEASHSENGISRTWILRDRLFAGVLPLSAFG